MNEYSEVIEVRSIHGTITGPRAAWPEPGAIFEIRTEDADGKVRGAVANEKGRFKMRGVPQGEYVFKATQNGFQSVFGRIRVSRKAKAKNDVRIALEVGV